MLTLNQLDQKVYIFDILTNSLNLCFRTGPCTPGATAVTCGISTRAHPVAAALQDQRRVPCRQRKCGSNEPAPNRRKGSLDPCQAVELLPGCNGEPREVDLHLPR